MTKEEGSSIREMKKVHELAFGPPRTCKSLFHCLAFKALSSRSRHLCMERWIYNPPKFQKETKENSSYGYKVINAAGQRPRSNGGVINR